MATQLELAQAGTSRLELETWRLILLRLSLIPVKFSRSHKWLVRFQVSSHGDYISQTLDWGSSRRPSPAPGSQSATLTPGQSTTEQAQTVRID